MAKKFQRSLIHISDERGKNNINSIKIKSGYPYFIYNYYLWFWTEFSKNKTKRRKANKLARKQRKLNNKK
jgi:hypothetical protein